MYNFVIMLRTQISLERNEYAEAKATAQMQGISLAEMMRRALRAEIHVDKSKPWMKYSGFIESGKSTTGDEVDEVVYGHKS